MFEYSLPQFRVLSFDQHLKTHSLFLHSTRHDPTDNQYATPVNSRFTPTQTYSVRRPTGVHRPAVRTCVDACRRACSVSDRSEGSRKARLSHLRTRYRRADSSKNPSYTFATWWRLYLQSVDIQPHRIHKAAPLHKIHRQITPNRIVYFFIEYYLHHTDEREHRHRRTPLVD